MYRRLIGIWRKWASPRASKPWCSRRGRGRLPTAIRLMPIGVRNGAVGW
jgi:hypothetical protein